MGEQREIVSVNQMKIAVTALQPAKRQITMEEPTQENNMDTQTWDSSHSKSKTIDDLIGEMIALQNLPFNFVEGIGFRRFMQVVSPNYELREHKFYEIHVYDKIYKKITIKIREMLKLFHKLSINMDICSEQSANALLLTFTAHGITEDFDQRQIVLKCCLLCGNYSDDIICDYFTKMMLEWDIKEEQLHCFIHNGKSIIEKVTHLANVPNVNCVVHQLQLCVCTALETPEIKDLIAKCKQITGHCSQSQIAKEELFKIQREQLNQPTLNVILDCDNRWNGTYHMVERLLKIKDSISLYACKHDIPQISPEEWLTLNKIIAVLTPFEEITTILTKMKTCISSVIPLIHVLKHKLRIERDSHKTNQYIANFIIKLIGEVNVKFCDLSNNMLYSLATYLDPRYKSKFFNEIEKEQVQSELLRLLMLRDLSNVSAMSDIDDDDDGDDREDGDDNSEPRFVTKRLKIEFVDINNEPCTSSQNLQSMQNINSDLAAMLNGGSDDENTGNDSIGTNMNLIVLKSLINEYNNQKRLQLNEDPLLWWRYNIQFQAFLPIVRTYLSTPPGSFPSEQLSNGSGSINEPFYNHLDSDNYAKLLFVKYNLPLVNFDY
ncbi:zinc finger BED domain-containing protein 4-like [Melitaea cinxia]|uniref:zinc finger BED domain-containing protein 4-like n=1 Tax=Melitaea cinxia TaxID=113334 RepID=UPI001E26EAD0|nr:zinc finger BED domain-containing protein 4-like [Melitaea cinxia]